jgi:hypothetical protein
LTAFSPQRAQRRTYNATEGFTEGMIRRDLPYPVTLADAAGENCRMAHQTTSAKLRSTRKKYRKPKNKLTMTTEEEMKSVEATGGAAPSSPQRKPSTTLTIGLRPYKARHRSGTKLLE